MSTPLPHDSLQLLQDASRRLVEASREQLAASQQLLDLSRGALQRAQPAAPAAPAAPQDTPQDRQQELLLDPAEDRHALLPVRYPKIWELYKVQERATWFADEINLREDREEFRKLPAETQHFIKMILGFFAISDAIVADNIGINFAKEVTIREARACYNFQARMEDVHNETYSLLLTEYVEDEQERAELLNSIEHHESIRNKAEWAQRYMAPGADPAASFPRRLLAFACVEGIFFSGSFCAIYWLDERGYKLRGLIDSNRFIAKDEGQHTLFACHLYSMVRNRLSQEEAHQIVRDAVDLETEFINDALRCELIGMNAGLMAQYIQFVADGLLASLQYEPLYGVKNPFFFMEKIGLNDMTSFFERENTEYQKAAVSSGAIQLSSGFSVDF